MELVDFLRQRFDEEEAAARVSYDEAGDYRIVGSEATELHFANWKPDRVLAEVEAKRQIMTLHYERDLDECALCYDHKRGKAVPWPCETFELLALPFADHEDYDSAWRL